MPLIAPRFLTNHLTTVVKGTTSEALKPIPITMKTKYICQIAPTCDINRWPTPKNKALAVRTTLGPNLSANIPISIAIKPIMKKAREDAPESIALVEPNSTSNGVKKTPKVLYVPWIIIMMEKPAATTM